MNQILNVNNENISMLYHKGTNGESIILLHPALAQAVFYMPVFQELSERGFTVAAIDFPNHGSSEGTSRTTIEEFADFTEDLVIALHKAGLIGDMVNLVGWSMGGTTSYEIATRNPSWLKSVTMLSSSNYWGFDPLPFTEEEYDNGQCTRKAENLEQSYIREFLNTAKAMLPPFSSCEGDWNACSTYDGRDKAHMIKVPLLHAWGGQDELGAQSGNEHISAHVATATSEYYEEATHNLPVEKPAVVASITEFILHTI